MEVNRSPCRPDCPNRVLSEALFSDGSLLCISKCLDIALYQSALAKAAIVGVPVKTVCPICRDTGDGDYCQRCRDRVQADIDRRANPAPLPKTPFGPKHHAGNWRTRSTDYSGYRMIFKQGRKSGSCHKCKKIIKVGTATMAKNMSKVRGNNRYICIDCWDEIQGSRKEAA